MKKVIISFLLALSIVSTSVAAQRPLGMEEYTSVDQLASAIASYFPKVQGEVKTIQGDRLTIALGRKEGLQPGVTLTLWRDGKEILHPVTGEVIGREEEEVGSIEITNVGETTSTGVLAKRVKDPKQGDKARITPKKIALALIPLRADQPEILQNLSNRLNENGRFSVLGSEAMTAFLKDRKQRDSSLIRELGQTFKLDVVAAIGIYPSDNKFLVTTRLLYADEPRPLDTIVALLDLRTKKDVLGEVKPFFAPAKGEKSTIAELPFDAQLFAAADLDRSGKLEYIFSDGARLHIYREGRSEWSEVWVETIAYSVGEMQHFNLDVADINGNGNPEIFVTGMLNGKVVSYVIEYREGAYQRIAEVPGFLRVISPRGKESLLIGQVYDPESFFAGQPRRYAWSDKKYVPGAEFSLPKGVGLYGFMFADLGEANPLLAALDENEQLRIYSKDNVIWKSEEKYPAIGITVKKPVTGIDAVLDKQVAEEDKSLKVKIKGRVYALDLNGDGKDEIILPKNSGAGLVGGYTTAEIDGLGWTGARMEMRWNIKEVDGIVLDYQVLPLPGMGAQILALVKKPGGVFKGDTLRVVSYVVK